MKLCSRCKVEKPKDQFRSRKNRACGVTSECTDCCKIRDKSRYRNKHLLETFGIDTVEFDRILATQDGKCNICGTEHNNGKHFDVDHDHISNEVRGLLCRNCNRGIGYLGDNIVNLYSAIRHLTKMGKGING